VPRLPVIRWEVSGEWQGDFVVISAIATAELSKSSGRKGQKIDVRCGLVGSHRTEPAVKDTRPRSLFFFQMIQFEEIWKRHWRYELRGQSGQRSCFESE
jgi:hypothetical protein